jgi:hypothetical protein
MKFILAEVFPINEYLHIILQFPACGGRILRTVKYPRRPVLIHLLSYSFEKSESGLKIWKGPF